VQFYYPGSMKNVVKDLNEQAFKAHNDDTVMCQTLSLTDKTLAWFMVEKFIREGHRYRRMLQYQSTICLNVTANHFQQAGA